MSTKTDNSQIHLQHGVRSHMELLRRWTLAFLGILCVGLAVLGAILPGLPATIFLMAACFLFAKSCPQLERILVRNRFFSAFHQYLDGNAEMPLRARVVTLMVMWAFIAVSTSSLIYSGVLHWAIALLIPAAGLVGSYFVWTFGRNRASEKADN